MRQIISVKNIEKIYHTGEEPVLVACNDHNSYICKYTRYSGSANKLVSELMGALFAKLWNINTPDIALVKVQREHIPHNMNGAFFSRPILGSLQHLNVVDITPATIPLITPNEKLCGQLLKIALFDLWLSNEDRNANNANLMYDMVSDNIIAIDYGCCFNTATFDYPLSLLTETDSILCSDLFTHITQNIPIKKVLQLADALIETEFRKHINACRTIAETLQIGNTTDNDTETHNIPAAWNINRSRLTDKIEELLSEEWMTRVHQGFVETLHTALHHE